MEVPTTAWTPPRQADKTHTYTHVTVLRVLYEGHAPYVGTVLLHGR
jgi:hypothetical protein